LIFFSVS